MNMKLQQNSIQPVKINKSMFVNYLYNMPEVLNLFELLLNFEPNKKTMKHILPLPKTVFLLALVIMFSNAAKALNPSAEYKVTPDKFGMQYKEEKVKTTDGAVLNAWFFENAKKNPNWIVISGSGDGNMADNLEIVNSFLSAGYNVATYDYRGYGKSSEFKIDPDRKSTRLNSSH